MKRMMAMVLMMVMVLGSVPVWAGREDSEKMQEVLLLVKEKITVPEEFSEFSGSVSEYNDKRTYYFEWTTPDYEKTMSVESDEAGRIFGYRRNDFEPTEKRLSSVSKEELIAFAEEFLKKTAPETFPGDNDGLVYEEKDYYPSGNLTYNLGFRRQKDGIEVKDNYANVRVCVVEDVIRVRNMNLSFAYDAEFEEPKQDIADVSGKYRALFPAELIYRDEYQPLAEGREARFVPVLVYRIKDDRAGYMDSDTGEVLTEDALVDGERKEAATEDSAANMGVAGGGSSLTPQERAELEKIEGLKSDAEIEKAVRSLPYLDFPADLALTSSNLYTDSLGKYYYRMYYARETEEEHRYFHLRANAETGEVLELSGYSGGYKKGAALTDAARTKAEEKMTKFLNAAAKEKFAETRLQDSSEYGSMLNQYFVRMVNDVPYPENGIRLTFDAETQKVRDYSLNFTDGEFANPQEAIGETAAYEKILDYAPITPIYIMSGGRYQKAFSLSKGGVAVDALSGEVQNKESVQNYQYLDMDGHWAEEAAVKLSEIQVGLPGGRLEPESAITQEDFLRLLASAVMGQFYGEYSTEELYERLISGKFVREEEKAPEEEILREDAFVYIIRMAGLERVAKLQDIYKVSYHDQAALSPERIGYAAILSGLGVVCGDGGNLRPRDVLTRAEAIAVVYQYLLSL